MADIRVHFSYSKNDNTKKYSVEVGEIYCVCDGKIEEHYIERSNRESRRKEHECNNCHRKYKLNKKDVKNEILKRIRSRYPEEMECLAS